MRLPNGDKAVVDDHKLIDYCLSPSHPRGRHKARLFEASTGVTQANYGLLKQALLNAVAANDARPTKQNDFGEIYEVGFQLAGPSGSATILSVWIVAEDQIPRLVTCYPV